MNFNYSFLTGSGYMWLCGRLLIAVSALAWHDVAGCRYLADHVVELPVALISPLSRDKRC